MRVCVKGPYRLKRNFTKVAEMLENNMFTK